MEIKVDRAIKLLRSVSCDVIEISYSGGKDSDVILELAKMADVPYRAIYKNTTIDPPGTIAHCKANGAEIVRPKMSFFDIIRKKGFPTRRARFCCEILKEYKMLDNSVQGIRACESVKRAALYKEPIICRTYGPKSNHVNIVLPILDWTDKDVSDFIQIQKINCHPLYYVDGIFDVTKRLGCIACPLKSDQASDFIKYPKMAKAWIDAGKDWWNTPPQ